MKASGETFPTGQYTMCTLSYLLVGGPSLNLVRFYVQYIYLAINVGQIFIYGYTIIREKETDKD